MDIEQARKLRRGSMVKCPPDRGSKGFTGKVDQLDCATAMEHTSHQGLRFIWIAVRDPGGRPSIWPSTRLG